MEEAVEWAGSARLGEAAGLGGLTALEVAARMASVEVAARMASVTAAAVRTGTAVKTAVVKAGMLVERQEVMAMAARWNWEPTLGGVLLRSVRRVVK